jgi:hypothetical protein
MVCGSPILATTRRRCFTWNIRILLGKDTPMAESKKEHERAGKKGEKKEPEKAKAKGGRDSHKKADKKKR